MTFSTLGIDTQTRQRVELPKSSRLQGTYIIGATGSGKSGLLENLIMQDIKQGIGVCVLDPHGELIDKVLARLEQEDEAKVILIDAETLTIMVLIIILVSTSTSVMTPQRISR